MSQEDFNPYRTPVAVVDIVVHDAELELANRGTRLAAVLIDGAIGLLISVPAMWFTGFWARAMAQQVSLFELIAWAVGSFVVFVLIHGFPLHHWGQTWGKRILGIRIVDLDGRIPGLLPLLAKRYLPLQVATQFPMPLPLLGLIDALMIFTRDRRCLHDLLAGTRVVNGNPTPPAAS